MAKIKRVWIHWLAILLVAMYSVAPSISFAVNHIHHDKTIEFCSVDGVKTITLHGESSQYTHHNHDNSKCGYCSAPTHFACGDNLLNLDYKVANNSNILPFFYSSKYPNFSWIKLPSQAPPQKNI